MAIDPSIAMGVRPVQTPNMLAEAGQASQLQTSMMQNAAISQEMEGQNALRKWQMSGGDINSADAPNQMLKMGVPLKAVQSFVKTGLEQRKLGGEVTKQDLDITQRIMGDLANNPSNENITANVQDLLKANRISSTQAQSLLNQALQVPIDKRAGLFTNMAVDAKTKYEKTTVSAGEQARLGQAERHFQQGLTQGAIPAGYRMNANKELEPIPGGPTTTSLAPKELQAREAKYPMATQAVNTFEAKTNQLEKDLITLRDHPGLGSITGIVAGRAPAVTKEGREAQALYDKIVARGGFKELQDMRAASPTGGALGNVSNQEGTQLRQSFAAIDRRQDASSVQKAIGDAISDLQGSKSRIREAYDMTYDYKGSKAPTSPPAPSAGDNTVAIPGGKVLTFPTPEAAAAYKKAAGL